MKLKVSVRIGLLIIIGVSMMACKKDKRETPAIDPTAQYYTSATFLIKPQSYNTPLQWDSICNTNAAGNNYSVNKINFYISNIQMKRADGYVFNSNRIFYIDAKEISRSSFVMDSIPNGLYTEITFLVGLDSLRNIDFGLESTLDNLNMAWPNAMGGGYHFIKIEGHYKDATNLNKGYAIHLGKNKNLTTIKINKELIQDKNANYLLNFNLEEVFMTPYEYNLNLDKSYTMSDSVAMYKIKTNLGDAFKIIQSN